MGTQSSLHLSPQTCSHFQNALNLIFEYYHPSFQQRSKPRAVLQKMPGPARVFHLCLGRVAPTRLPTPGMCSGSPRTSLLLVPQLDKSVEASCSLGAGEPLGGLCSSLNFGDVTTSAGKSRGPESALPKPVCTCLCQTGNNWVFPLGSSFSSYTTKELAVAPFLPGTVKSPMQSQSVGRVHPSLFRRKPNLTLRG